MAPGGQSRLRAATLDSFSNQQPRSSHANSSPSAPIAEGTPQLTASPTIPTTGTTSASTTTRKGRGKARNMALRKHIAATGQRVRIEIEDGMLRPVKGCNTWFVNELGTICRTHAPVTCKDWSEVDDDRKEIFYNHILEFFDIDLHVPHVKFAVDDYLKDRFKDYRHKIHKYFKKLGGGNQALRGKSFDGMAEQHWKDICARFMSEPFQKRSKINTENRKNMVINHYGGSKSFAQYREDLRKEDGEAYGMINFYEKMRYQPEKGWINEKAKERHDLMVATQSEPVPEGGSPLTEEAICEKVLGKRKGLGNGVRIQSSSKFSQFNRAQVERANQRAEESERRAEEFRQDLQIQRDQMQEMELRQKQMEAQIQALLASRSS